jgi:hypothetical protein
LVKVKIFDIYNLSKDLEMTLENAKPCGEKFVVKERKIFLYLELFSLNKSSTKKKLLKK